MVPAFVHKDHGKSKKSPKVGGPWDLLGVAEDKQSTGDLRGHERIQILQSPHSLLLSRTSEDRITGCTYYTRAELPAMLGVC